MRTVIIGSQSVIIPDEIIAVALIRIGHLWIYPHIIGEIFMRIVYSSVNYRHDYITVPHETSFPHRQDIYIRACHRTGQTAVVVVMPLFFKHRVIEYIRGLRCPS